jgi:hypothetical protein
MENTISLHASVQEIEQGVALEELDARPDTPEEQTGMLHPHLFLIALLSVRKGLFSLAFANIIAKSLKWMSKKGLRSLPKQNKSCGTL